MKLGTSLRFLYPTGEHTHVLFKQMLAALPPGSFIERPLGATDTGRQARNVLEVASAARAAGLDGLLFGDNHAVPAAYANSFSPIPTLARLMAVTGEMPVGLVLLAPFYHPIVLAEQIGTLAAFAGAPLIVTLANGGRAQAFDAFGLPMASRAARLEELVAIVRALLSGERVTFRGRHFALENVSSSPLPRVPVSIWIAGTVPAAAARAGRIGDGWLSGQNATRAELAQQLDVYREAAARAGRAALPVLRRDIYVGESDAEAEATAGRVLAEGYRGTGMDQLLVGGAASVVEQLHEYRKLGFDFVMVRHIVGDHEAMLRSFARIGEAVMPAIRDL
jgi:alkanesulfonate monooxygenase SsuD/methylene tetrahydromethanopterin reductase-like flavin-dependent oxidoreductase (luciferase family)